ncbi:MAG: hypothetical protein HZC29_06820 [Thaumarchaeota archaeon]|nr:hypothetical protein [Nitrososphaerota archaeon]
MQLNTGFTLSLVNGNTSGNPANIQNGDIVCTGSTVRVSPTVTARWATPTFDAVSIYPTCGGGFCPAMIPAGGVATNQNIHWLSSATWTDNKNFGDGNDFSQDPARYNQLGAGSFSNEPVTYNNNVGEFHPGMEGGAAVFCKGSLDALDGGSVAETRISNAACFASIVKHPTNLVDNPPWFYFYYFTHNAPAIAAESATQTISITAQDAGGNCAMHQTSITPGGSLSSDSDILVKVAMHNDGDTMQVTGVSSSNAGYTVSPFPTASCGVLGFPPSLCPADNGFNHNINSGASRDLYVLVHNNGGAVGGTTLSFTATTTANMCGGSATCSHDVPIDGPITCAITPSSLTYGTQEVAQFNVVCKDLAANPIACVGSNWFWSGGLSGGFITKTNTGAQAYPTSPPGSSGFLSYQSGLALCNSSINVVTPTYQCEFIPPSANMNTSTSQFFQLNCFENGTQHNPDSADYDRINGLGGSTNNASTHGVTYNAPGSPSAGDLRGFGHFLDAPSPILGAVAIAPINVVNGSNMSGNNTNNSTACIGGTCPGPGGPGSTQYCTIGNGPFNPFNGYFGWLGIKCGEHANESCSTVNWGIQPPGVGTLSGSSASGTYVTINAVRSLRSLELTRM